MLRLPLATARLELRPFTVADAAAMRRVYGDAEVMRHVGRGDPADAAGAERMLRSYIAHQARHGFSFWGVVERATGSLIGDAGLAISSETPSDIELGYTLARDAWGRGYATEAARACVQAAFGPLELDEVVALVVPENTASGRVLEKLGFRVDGNRRAFEREHRVFRLARPPVR